MNYPLEIIKQPTPVSEPMCKRYGFCTNLCEFHDHCNMIRTKLLIHCLIVAEDNNTYYPVEYINDLPQYSPKVQVTSSIVSKCSCPDCNNILFYSREFYDTNVGYTAGLEDRKYYIYCSNECRQKYVDQLIEQGYTRINKK